VLTGYVVTEETWCLYLSSENGDYCVSSVCAMFIWLFELATVVIWLGCSWKYIGDICCQLLGLNWGYMLSIAWIELVCAAMCVLYMGNGSGIYS
jgi:hypothetical protein